MDEAVFIILFVLAIFIAPIVLSIVALVSAAKTRRELDALRSSLSASRTRPAEPTPPAPAVAVAAPGPAQPKKTQAAPPPAPPPRAPKPTPVSPPAAPPRKPGPGVEVALGGKVASFVGIAALILGVAFFVGYAMQHGWIGPGARIVLGLFAGGLLVGLGHLAECRGRNLQVLARVLTGGGAALFYFSVFAAYSIYSLIGPVLAGVGLVLSAAAVLALATVYGSQVIAVIGVVGAFVTPALIGGDFEHDVFPLVFIAVINVPVILMGLRRKWQVLYNVAFVFTVGYTTVWLESQLPGIISGAWRTGLAFSLIYFAEFIALGLIKLRREPQATGRTLDTIRLLLTSLALLGALQWVLSAPELKYGLGAAYLAAALLHILLVRAAWRFLPRFRDETLALLVSALTFATMALPAQLDGAWVSMGWAVEGVALAWFAMRVRSPVLQIGAIALGLLGLCKSLVFDVTLYTTAPPTFLNGRFIVGLVSSVLLGVQGWLDTKWTKPEEARPARIAYELLVCVALLGFVVSLMADVYWVLSPREPWPWMVGSLGLMGAALMATWLGRGTERRRIWALGVLLLLVLPVKILFFDMSGCWHVYDRDFPVFFNLFFGTELAMLVVLLFWVNGAVGARFAGPGPFPLHVVLNIAAIASCIGLVTMEIGRSSTSWNDSLVTLWWAVSGFALAGIGLVKKQRYLRYLALAVFGITTVKVFLVDLEELSGLHRVAAFMGVGLLLLVLSFVYQRIAPVLTGESESEPDETGNA